MSPEIIRSILTALTFTIVMIVLAIGISVWYRKYSGRAKALSRRLGDIVNLRSASTDDHLIKHYHEENNGLKHIAFASHIIESLKLILLRSGIEMSIEKLMTISIGLFVSSVFLFSLFFNLNSSTITIFSLLIGATPILYIKHKEHQRSLAIENQLPEALDFICRSLRAGHGLAVSFGMVGDELPAPINKEFKTVFEEINFGLPFNDAMSNFAIRVNSNDVSFLVVGLLIQREAGGNLIELLENLAKTVRDRMILNGKVRVLASEGKYSGILLSVLPFLLGGILAFINPKYMALLWTTDIGQSLMIGGLLLISLGALWMWKITRIKV